MADDGVWVDVADAVAALRHELTAAMAAAEEQALRFEVAGVEMEFDVVVRRSGGGSGAVNLGVVTLGGQQTVGRDDRHRLLVKLNPRDAVTGRAVEISGRADDIPAH
ncbi:trypco2 family protein [Streptomyces sp. NPDC004031]